jgi:hypothetical protein
MSKWVTVSLAVTICIAAFLITLWLTERPTPADLLAKHVMPDDAAVRAAAALEGLSESPDLKGVVDSAIRKDASTVNLVGWAADLNGSRLTVLALVDGKSTMNVETSGPRPDVVQALRLPANSAPDLQFRRCPLLKGAYSPPRIRGREQQVRLRPINNLPVMWTVAQIALISSQRGKRHENHGDC